MFRNKTFSVLNAEEVNEDINCSDNILDSDLKTLPKT